MYSLPTETPTLLASCFRPTTKESIAIRENASEQKVQSISDKKYSIYRKMKALCPIFSPTVSPAQTSTSPPSYLPRTPCFKTRSWSPAKQNWVLYRRNRSENNTSQPTCTTMLAAPMHTVVFPCRQHRTAQLQSPADCEQCLRVIVILWNQ